MSFVFIDESGDLGFSSSGCFTVAALVSKDDKQLSRIIKKLRERKLKKKLKETSEIKANNSSNVIRAYVLNKISALDCKLFCINVNKKEVQNIKMNSKEFYAHLCTLLISKILDYHPKTDLIIICDKRFNNKIETKQFEDFVFSKLKIRVKQLHSHEHPGLQLVDFVAWCINRKLNEGSCIGYTLIESKIIKHDFKN